MLRSLIVAGVLPLGSSHPLTEVVELIQELKKQAKTDQEDADITFEQTTHEYGNARKELESQIKAQQDLYKEKNTEFETKAEEARAMEHEITLFDKKLKYNKDDEAKLTSARDKENELFLETEQNLKDALTALDEVLAEFEKGAPAAMTQKEMKVIAGSFLPKNKMITKLLEEPGDVRTYDSKTGDVKVLFEQLVTQFKDKLNQVQLDETNSANAHELSVKALQGTHKSISTLKTETEVVVGEAKGASDAAKAEAKEARAAEEQFSQDLRDKFREYERKKENYELVSKERRQEVDAMNFAMDILKSIGHVRADHEELESSGPSSGKESLGEGPIGPEALQFLQESTMSPKDTIAALLRQTGLTLHNTKLQHLAMEISTMKGPFTQIGIMIQRMLDRLVDEQRQEDDHKDWCDREMKKTESGKEDKTIKLERVEVDIETAESKQEENKMGKVNARKEIITLQERQESETTMRRKEKKNNEHSISDAKKAQGAIQRALRELEKWKASTSESNDPTAGHNKIIELLEGAGKHYMEMESDVQASESQAAVDFQESMNDIKKSIATLNAQIEGHDNTLNRLSRKMTTLLEKKKHNKDGLFAINQYIDDLSPACVGEEGAYEKRKAARTKEKDALKEALTMLDEAFNKPSAGPVDETIGLIKKVNFLQGA